MRVSVTDVDALRYFMAQDDGDLEKLLRQLRREEPPTDAMRAGTAFHAALELAQEGEVEDLEAQGYSFEIAADVAIELPDIREVKAVREYRVGDCDVQLVGKVDALAGRYVYDHKLTGRFDPERFLSGFQWRAYLEIFEANHFVWNVFEAPLRAGDQSNTRRITAFHRLGADRYPGLPDDVVREIEGFVAFARVHLPERIA